MAHATGPEIAMAYRDMRDFLATLDKMGQL